MAVVTITTFNEDGTVARNERTTYNYDESGIRVSALHEVDSDGDGVPDTATLTEYLNAPLNITGYSQVLKQTETDLKTGEVTITTYVIGLQRISQIVEKSGTKTEYYFTFDGHGSTRVLTDFIGTIVELYSYDAFGNALDFDPATALTEFLYSGEQFDSKINQQYLRQRYYDPTTGRFNRLDPFFGILNDPLSLHKYLYTHDDPISGIDPTGLSWGASIASTISMGMQLAVGCGGTAARAMFMISNNLALNLYVRGTVYLAHLASKYPTVAQVTSAGVAVLNIYSTANSPNPVEAFAMGPVDDIYNMTRSLSSFLKSSSSGLKQLLITNKSAVGQVRPLGVFAVIDRNTLRSGTAANHHVIPLGFNDLPDVTDPLQRARAHLLGKVFGGKGTQENLVTLYQNANLRMRDTVENPIVRSLEGVNPQYDEVRYFANAVYDGVTEYPKAIEVFAFGVKNGEIETFPFIAVTILNQK